MTTSARCARPKLALSRTSALSSRRPNPSMPTSNVVIRQAIFDWQIDPPTLILNVLKTSADGDQSAGMLPISAPALCDQVKGAILTKAQAKYGERPVSVIVPSSE